MVVFYEIVLSCDDFVLFWDKLFTTTSACVMYNANIFFFLSKNKAVENGFKRNKRDKFGKCFTKYDDLSTKLFFVLFGEQSQKIHLGRVEMAKRFLEAIYKLPLNALNIYDKENNELPMEIVDYVRMRLLCALPLPPDVQLTKWVDAKLTMDSLLKRHPSALLEEDDIPIRKLSLKNHSYVGMLYGYEIMENNQKINIWSSEIKPDNVSQGKYSQYRIDVSSISPTTLLMFFGLGYAKMQVSDDYNFYFPKMAVHLHGLNQREITDMGRLFNPTTGSGLIDMLLKDETTVSWGIVPYLVYPYHEKILMLKKSPTNQDKGTRKQPQTNATRDDVLQLTSTIRTGTDSDTIDLGHNASVKAYDIDFDAVCMAYKAVFGKYFSEIYEIDDAIQNAQLRSLLAMGCLIKDIDKLCNGFRYPETTFPSLYEFLEKRVSELVFNGSRLRKLPTLQILSMGRTIPEAFFRIRLMFRFLLGDIFHGIVDGCCRLTAMCYSWLGMSPERNMYDLIDSHKRLLPKEALYVMMSSSSTVHVLMSGKTYAKKNEKPISHETLEMVEQYSIDAQRNYAQGQPLAIQNFILEILHSYKRGYPFGKPFEFSVEEDVSEMVENATVKGKAKKTKTIVKREEAFELMFQYLALKLAKTPQKDITSAITQDAKKSLFYLLDKYNFVKQVNFYTFPFNRRLLTMIVKFLLLGCVMKEIDDDDNSFIEDFLDLLISFVENNGKNWSTSGDHVRNAVPCLKNPLTNAVMGSKECFGQKTFQTVFSKEFEANELESMKSEDTNVAPNLLVSNCVLIVVS